MSVTRLAIGPCNGRMRTPQRVISSESNLPSSNIFKGGGKAKSVINGWAGDKKRV